MSFEMLSDLGIKKYEMCRDEPGRFFARAIVAGLYLGIHLHNLQYFLIRE